MSDLVGLKLPDGKVVQVDRRATAYRDEGGNIHVLDDTLDGGKEIRTEATKQALAELHREPAYLQMNVDEFKAMKGGKATVRSKYGAQPQVYQGHRYASKAELAFRMHLDLLKANGYVLWYLFQTPIHLPAGEGVKGTRYVMDFLVMLKDGTVRGVDVKGRDTPTSKVKRSVASSVVAFKIETVTRERDGSFNWPN